MRKKTPNYTSSRNSAILFFILILVFGTLFLDRYLKSSVYIEPQENVFYLRDSNGNECRIPYQEITSVTLADTLKHAEEYQLFTTKKADDYILICSENAHVAFNYESNDVTDAIYPSLRELLEEKGVLDQITFTSYQEEP